MIYNIVAIIIYEVFAGLQKEFLRQGIISPAHNKSALEGKIFSSSSNLDLIFSTFCAISRINGIVFLVYLGYKTAWWHPIVFWVLGQFFMMLFSIFCGGRTGFIIPAFLAFLILPVLAVYLWQTI